MPVYLLTSEKKNRYNVCVGVCVCERERGGCGGREEERKRQTGDRFILRNLLM